MSSADLEVPHKTLWRLNKRPYKVLTILLITCCHIGCALFCLVSVFAIVVCVSFSNGLSKGCLRILTALNPVFSVCSLCTASLLLADHFPIGSPYKILSICRQNERRIKGWLLNAPWQRNGLLFFYSKSPPYSGAFIYICFVKDITEKFNVQQEN